MSGEFTLNSDRMQVVFRNERGVSIKRKRFKRGDVITAEDLPDGEERFNQLVEAGTLVPKDEAADETEDQDEDSEGSEDGADGSTPDYDAMEYPALQKAAEARGLPFNGVNKNDIIASLKAADEA